MKFKVFKLIFFFVLSSNYSYSQFATNTELKDTTNIYYQTLKLYCNGLAELKDSTLYIEQNNLTTKSIPNRLNNYNIKVIDFLEVQSLSKKNEDFKIIRIVPLRIKNGDFFVNIINFKVNYQRKRFEFINLGGEKIIYKYENNVFEFVEIK